MNPLSYIDPEDWLRERGYDLAQGHFIARPLSGG